MPLNRRDGSYFGTLCALDPLPATLGEDDFAVFHLLSHLIAFELEADENQRRREGELRAMEDVISIAAHDLRQPMTILQGRAQQLARKARRGITPDELTTGLQTLVDQTRRAVQLSDLLLDTAHIGAGSFTLDRTPFDLISLATQLLGEARDAAPAHTFVLDAPANLVIDGDERRLGQVLTNLLGNAAKYTPADSGPILLRIAAQVSGDTLPMVLISVQDSGIGVPQAELGQLFQRQYRASNAMSQGISGSGLGLYIARQFVEAHGGTIWAERASEGGLLMQLTVPLRPGDPPAST